MAVLQWIVVVLAVSSSTWGKLTVCPVNKLQFLSYNTTLLPRANVQASSESTNSNPLDHFIMQNAGPWCSDFNDVYNPNLHINFTFTEPVVITFLQSSGYFNAFVDSFSMQYALGREGGIFMPYGVLQAPQVFNVNHESNYFEEAYFSLEKQLVAERLKLQIHHSVFESSNRSCWSLKVLGCTFREAVTIEEEGDNIGSPEPCLPYNTSDNDMMNMHTAYPEPTTLPEPCTGTGSSDPEPSPTDPEMSRERIMTIVLPVAVFTIVLCAVMVGLGVLCCYIIVARKSSEEGRKSKYHEGVTVRTLSHKGIPVPKEPGNEQKIFARGSRKDSVCSNNSDLFNYDMPRPIMYDVPRTPSQQQRAATVSCNEYRNPIYDRASSGKESNTYESIPYDLEQNNTGSASLPKPQTRTRRASDMLPHSQARGEQTGSLQAMHSSDPQMAQYSIVDKSKKAKETVPVFEVLYDHAAGASKDDIDKPIILPTS